MLPLPDGTLLGSSGEYGDAAPIETWAGLLPVLMERYRVIVP